MPKTIDFAAGIKIPIALGRHPGGRMPGVLISIGVAVIAAAVLLDDPRIELTMCGGGECVVVTCSRESDDLSWDGTYSVDLCRRGSR